MYYVGANLGENGVKIGDTLIGFRLQRKGSFVSGAKFHQNRLKIATVQCADRQTNKHTHKQTRPKVCGTSDIGH